MQNELRRKFEEELHVLIARLCFSAMVRRFRLLHDLVSRRVWGQIICVPRIF
jgi:hypothetical protein